MPISKMFGIWRMWQSGAGVAVWDVVVPSIGWIYLGHEMLSPGV
jgi:hypothetical protein